MADLLPIDNGRQQASFRRFKIVIPANGSYKLDNPFNYFRCYGATFEFKIMWSASNSQTDFGEGLGIRFNEVLPYVIIRNPGETQLIVDVGVGIGYFDDSRLTVSGTVKTMPAPYSFFVVNNVAIANGSVKVPAAARTIIQNTGANTMYIGAANGLQLQPQGSFEVELNEDFTVYGTDGDSLVIGSFN